MKLAVIDAEGNAVIVMDDLLGWSLTKPPGRSALVDEVQGALVTAFGSAEAYAEAIGDRMVSDANAVQDDEE